MMRKRFGRIIGITSVVGVTGNPGQANYAATKAGMIGMFKSIGKEYAKRGVTANCVAPGFIATPMTDKLNDKQREAILQMVPAGRLGGGADVAAAVVYLASDEAAYVTGQTLACERRHGDDLTMGGGGESSTFRWRPFGWPSLMKYVTRAKAWRGKPDGRGRLDGPLATVLI